MTHRAIPRRTPRPALVGSSIALALGTAFVESAIAQDADRVTIDANRCLEIEAADERLACFEREVGEARSNPPNTPVPPAAPAAGAAPAAAPRTIDISGQPQREGPDAQGELVGSIAALSFRAPNKYVVTLDNGQIWEQRVAERYLLRVGQRVKIYRTRWGQAHRLEADDLNGFIQVTRVR
jgi:hypothetical protein